MQWAKQVPRVPTHRLWKRYRKTVLGDSGREGPTMPLEVRSMHWLTDVRQAVQVSGAQSVTREELAIGRVDVPTQERRQEQTQILWLCPVPEGVGERTDCTGRPI